MKDQFSDAYFEANPSKVLGVPVMRSGRFGEVLEVKGSQADLNKIEVSHLSPIEFDFEALASVHKLHDLFSRIVPAPAKEDKKTENKTRFTHSAKSDDDLITDFSFGSELWNRYNAQISREELEAFLYAHPEIDSSKFIKRFENDADRLIQNGLLFYIGGKFEYLYEYITGNLSQKRSLVTRRESKEAKHIVENWGEDVLENQIAVLVSYTPKARKLTSDKNSIVVLPHASVSKFFTISQINSGLVSVQDKNNAWKEVESASLEEAFKFYLSKIADPEDFKLSTAHDIVTYYLLNRTKSIPSTVTGDLKKKAEQEALILKKNAKDDGDRIFLQFLLRELLPEDKQKFEVIWNENYNSYRSFSDKLKDGRETISKIPVGFSQSRYFGTARNGKKIPLILSDTQRNGIALTLIRSVLLGYGVGLGKTLTDIFAISQLVELGIAKRPLIVVPNNVYYKWRKEIVGEASGNEWFQGALPHFPNVRDLYNLNNDIVTDLKTFSPEEKVLLGQIKRSLELLTEELPAIKRTGKLTAKMLDESKNAYADKAREIADTLNAEFTKASTDAKDDPIYKTGGDRTKAEMELYHFRKANLVTVVKGVERITSFAEEFVKEYRLYLKNQEDYLIATLGKLKPVPQGTISMLTYEGLSKIGLKEPELIIERLYEILTQGDSLDNDRESAKIYARMEELAQSSFGNSKIFLDDLGIDSVHIDEVHMAKNIFDSVKGSIRYEYEKDENGQTLYKDGQPLRTVVSTESGDVSREFSFYQLTGSMSMRALLVYMMVHYLQIKNHNKGVVALSATPFSNSPLEIFSILSLINHEVLESSGFTGLKDFFDTFMKIELDIVITPDNRIEKDVVLKGFHNLPQLRQIILAIIDYKTNEQAGTNKPLELVYPSLENNLRSKMVMSELQQALMREVELFIDSKDEPAILGNIFVSNAELLPQGFAESIPKKKAKREYIELTPRMAGVVVMKAIAKMKQIAISPIFYILKEMGIEIGDMYPVSARSKTEKLLSPEMLVETSPKLRYVMGCVKSSLDYSRSHNLELSSQIIYSTWGVDLFPILSDYLSNPKNGFGIAKDQIGIITGKTSTAKKEAIKEKFNSGEILILFGSKSIQVGVDLQKNTSALYMLDFDWNPTDDEQVRGRHARQGNQHNWVRTVYPMLENSIDPIIFQYLLEKASRLREIWNVDVDLDEVDLSGIDFEKLKDELITDPWKRARIEVIREEEKFTYQTVFLQNQLAQLKDAPSVFASVTKNYESFIPIAHQFIDFYEQTSTEQTKSYYRDKATKTAQSLVVSKSELKEQQEKFKTATTEKIKLAAEKKIETLREKISNLQETKAEYPSKLEAELKEDAETTQKWKNLLSRYTSIEQYAENREDLQELSKFATKVKGVLIAPPASMRDFGTIFYKREQYANNVQSFKTALQAYLSIKERILDKLGYAITDVEIVQTKLQDDLQKIQVQIDKIRLSMDSRFERIKAEMWANSESFKSAEDRIEEFAKTNFLLEKKTPKRLDILANPPEEKPVIKLERDLDKEKARARMRMRIRILELQKQKAA